MVSVLCAAYNHEKFIKDAIEGVIRQKTNFEIELIIHDDASTDHTADIIKEYVEIYPNIIRPIFQKENQYMKHNITKDYLLPVVRGKYIAFCEGDDYWIDDYKLQEQVDFLESHSDYSMCMHNAIKYNYETGEQKVLNTFPKSGTYTQREQLMLGLGTDFPACASYILRADFIKQMPEFFFQSAVLDYPIRQYYANCGKIFYSEKVMSVYRACTDHSFMKELSQNQKFYNNYTIKMIRFFEKFDIYTEYNFHDILNDKIMSDYLGFCLSIAQDVGMQKAADNHMNLMTVKKCYQYISTDFLDPQIRMLNEEGKVLFVYGTSRVSAICSEQLIYAGIDFEGFVVSDGQTKADKWEEKRVYFLSDVIARYPDAGFIIAMQPINARSVQRILNSKGITAYCIPYMINAE